MNAGIPLNTGATVPALGLGTWQSPAGEVKNAVLHALKSGYRHVDCAFVYGNEREVGEALKEAFASGVCKREDIFITTKLWCTYHKRARENLEESLARLGLDYVDLYLMHWPCPMNPNGNHPLFPKLEDGARDLDYSTTHIKTWKSLEDLYQSESTKSKIRAIGVANYSKRYLEQLLSHASVTPAVNQIENHPYLPQQEVVDFCREKGIHVTAYSPFGSTGSPMFSDKVVQSVAEKHSTTAGTVLLSYHINRRSSVLAKSVTPSRIEQNRTLVTLDDEDMKHLEEVSRSNGPKRFVYPEFGVNFGFPDKDFGIDMMRESESKE